MKKNSVIGPIVIAGEPTLVPLDGHVGSTFFC